MQKEAQLVVNHWKKAFIIFECVVCLVISWLIAVKYTHRQLDNPLYNNLSPTEHSRVKAFLQKQVAEATAKGIPVEMTNSIGMEFVYVPSGTFMMGSPVDESGHRLDETRHQVTISRGFYISRHEVTEEQYVSFSGQTEKERHRGDYGAVSGVTWGNAVSFCQKLSASEERFNENEPDPFGNWVGKTTKGPPYRLPTEAEWEYACRAGTTTPYFFGEDIDLLDHYAWGNSNYSHDVGQKEPNPIGLYDIYGNVPEWCSDWKAAYPLRPTTDPCGPSDGVARVLRGGGWDDSPENYRSASRHGYMPEYRDGLFRRYYAGFRVVLDVE